LLLFGLGTKNYQFLEVAWTFFSLFVGLSLSLGAGI